MAPRARNTRTKARTKADIDNEKPSNPLIQISEEEQRRLIRESGILNKIPGGGSNGQINANTPEETPFFDEFFNALFLSVPFSFLLLLMDLLINFQYSQNPTLMELLSKLAPNVPILGLFIFYSIRYKQTRWMQAILAILSVACGSRMIYMLNKSNWLSNIKQCPPLATVWIYTIVQLDLAPAVFSLCIIGAYVKFTGLTLLR